MTCWAVEIILLKVMAGLLNDALDTSLGGDDADSTSTQSYNNTSSDEDSGGVP